MSCFEMSPYSLRTSLTGVVRSGTDDMRVHDRFVGGLVMVDLSVDWLWWICRWIGYGGFVGGLVMVDLSVDWLWWICRWIGYGVGWYHYD